VFFVKGDQNGKQHAHDAGTFLMPTTLTPVQLRNERPSLSRHGAFPQTIFVSFPSSCSLYLIASQEQIFAHLMSTLSISQTISIMSTSTSDAVDLLGYKLCDLMSELYIVQTGGLFLHDESDELWSSDMSGPFKYAGRI
jgi:hypothetical protein